MRKLFNTLNITGAGSYTLLANSYVSSCLIKSTGAITLSNVDYIINLAYTPAGTALLYPVEGTTVTIYWECKTLTPSFPVTAAVKFCVNAGATEICRLNSFDIQQSIIIDITYINGGWTYAFRYYKPVVTPSTSTSATLQFNYMMKFNQLSKAWETITMESFFQSFCNTKGLTWNTDHVEVNPKDSLEIDANQIHLEGDKGPGLEYEYQNGSYSIDHMGNRRWTQQDWQYVGIGTVDGADARKFVITEPAIVNGNDDPFDVLFAVGSPLIINYDSGGTFNRAAIIQTVSYSAPDYTITILGAPITINATIQVFAARRISLVKKIEYNFPINYNASASSNLVKDILKIANQKWRDYRCQFVGIQMQHTGADSTAQPKITVKKTGGSDLVTKKLVSGTAAFEPALTRVFADSVFTFDDELIIELDKNGGTGDATYLNLVLFFVEFDMPAEHLTEIY